MPSPFPGMDPFLEHPTFFHPLHQAMIAMEEANVSLQLMVEVRNKLLESYQELMRMQV